MADLRQEMRLTQGRRDAASLHICQQRCGVFVRIRIARIDHDAFELRRIEPCCATVAQQGQGDTARVDTLVGLRHPHHLALERADSRKRIGPYSAIFSQWDLQPEHSRVEIQQNLHRFHIRTVVLAVCAYGFRNTHRALLIWHCCDYDTDRVMFASRVAPRLPAGVAGFARNHWQLAIGVSGNLALESVAGFARNQWQPSTGIRAAKL